MLNMRKSYYYIHRDGVYEYTSYSGPSELFETSEEAYREIERRKADRIAELKRELAQLEVKD
jgi:hypothetical protein